MFYMKKNVFILSLLWMGTLSVHAQVTIEECYQKAEANYPLIKQYGLIEKTKEYNLENASKGYLPQVSFSAKASYQSDVTKLPIDPTAMGLQGVQIPSLSKKQYDATLDINQTIWDGGAISAQKKRLDKEAEAEMKQIETSIYAVHERVNQLFFGILLADAQYKQNLLWQEELQRNYTQVESYMRNGIANQSDMDAIRVNLLKAKQDATQLAHTKKAYIAMLSTLTGVKWEDNVEFIKPVPVLPSAAAINRPELGLYQAQIQSMESKNRELTAGLMPKLGVFLTGGYGKPGLDMLQDEPKAYYLAGVRLSWNIGNFYTLRNNRKSIQAGIQQIEAQRETFLFNTSMDITQKESSIEQYTDQLKYDDDIIALRNSIKRASQAKMANGTLSGTDLVRDIHSEQMAIQEKILHETQRLLAIYNLKYATNN